MAVRDSKRSAAAAIDAVLSFAQMDVSAVVGGASSTASVASALVTSRLAIPQISHASTSDELSAAAYPYFMRTVPADSLQERTQTCAA